MSLPNYILLGAAKSATTSIYDILKQHQEIFAPKFKEPHFFDFDENFSKGLDWYSTTYYKNVKKEKVVFDFTPTYLYFSNCAERIHKSFGSNIKFIVLIRNPVDRAYSHYNHSVRDGFENLEFKSALEGENSRLLKYRTDNNILSEIRCSYISQGLYFKMLSAYLKYYDLDNFLIINFDDEIIKNSKLASNKLSDFLSLDLTGLDFTIHSNKSGKSKNKLIQNLILSDNYFRKILKKIVPQKSKQIIRNKIKNLNKEDFKYPALVHAEKQFIFKKYFQEDTYKLEKFLKIKTNWDS